MEVTEVKIYPVEENRLKAYVNIVFDDCFIVRDLKIVQGRSGLFVAMPSKRRKDGGYRDIAHPLKAETRRWIEKRIIDEYRAVAKENPGTPSETSGEFSDL